MVHLPHFALSVWFGLFTAVAVCAEPNRPLPPAATKTIDYARDVEPILQARCLECHGPDQQESGLRVDRRGSLLRGGDLGQPAVLVGNSAESFLLRAVAGLESDLPMPPDGERLAESEIAVLRAWIEQGLAMPKSDDEPDDGRMTTRHWSFQPIRSSDVLRPPAGDPCARDGWSRTPIDRFILAKLREHGLEPSVEAPRDSLIRRVYLDMLGLLPTPDEVAAFTADDRPDAHERLIDRVLASPRYGERWARHWLDVVRFADTNGFETNTPRPNAFRYRNYVIRAMNDDKPYDRFVFEQLAGDAAGEDVATGFLVAGPYDTVKSPDPNLTQMQRQDELADIINTTGSAFLGLTLGCARCHNHKFDPVTQRDYYAMQAVFSGVQHGERPIRTPDEAERRERLATVRQQLNSVEGELERLGMPLRPPVNARENVERFDPVTARFVRFTIQATNQYEPCIDELEIYRPAVEGRAAENVALASAGARATSSGDYPGNSKHKLEHIHDGRYGNSYSWISNQVGGGWVQIELASAMEIDRIVWGRDREQRYADRLPIEYVIRVADEPNEWQTVASSNDRLPQEGSVDEAIERRLADLPDERRSRVQPLVARWKELRAESQRLDQPAAVAYAGTFVQPDPTHRLYRGDPMQRREVVGPDALAVIGSLGLEAEVSEQQRRVALANWLIREDNPLTARVIANRIWHYHFGAGLVATPSDFGGNGAKPTHPELLDWLAAELMRSGWSLKHLHRVILTSATYRQSSRPRSDALAVDADSRWLWRFPPRRLEAEAIRDSLLGVSGSLDLAMYGPGFSVFQPNSNYVRVYEPKEKWGPAEWRRMVYMDNVRMEQGPVFGSFDCPDAGQPAPKRGVSTTAIQALSLLNSGFLLEQSERFAERVAGEAGGESRDQVERAFLLALGRSPGAEEAAAARELVDSHGLDALCRALFNANEFLFFP